MCCIGSESGCSPALGSSLFGSIANPSSTNEPVPKTWMLTFIIPRASTSTPFDSKPRCDLCFAADYARRISFPDMNGCVAAIWTPTAESLLQRRMPDHGFAIAQGLAQDQVAFRPMVVIGSGSHQNVTGCPLPYSFQRQQTIFYIGAC